MNTIGVVLVVIGLAMAWSGFSMAAKKKHYNEMVARGILAPFPREYGFHSLFKAYWWIPLGIGVSLVLFS